MECYFDNSATTRTDDKCIELMDKIMREDYGNPSSRHMMGVRSERYVKDAAKALASILKVNDRDIIFTSGGTESNNMAVSGYVMANKRSGKHMITTCFEHPSVLEPFAWLEKLPDDGFEVTYLSVDKNGHISMDELRSAIRKDTILVSVMMVNNEIGALQDIAGIGKIIKEENPDCAFHVDAVQGFGKYNIYPEKMNIDMLSASAHKIHGPKGAGFIYIREKLKIRPLLLGGGQQRGLRSGTDNTAGVAGLALAALNAYSSLDEDVKKLYELKDMLISGIEDMGRLYPGIKVNSSKGSDGAPHIVSCTFAPVKSEVMLHALEEKGIYVSSGSACSSNKPGLSGSLQAIGLSKEDADCTLRFSFSKNNSIKEVAYALEQIKELYMIFSKFVSR